MDKIKAQDQNKKQYDWLKGYQFVKGQSGNPGGRPKGSKSLKTFAKEFLMSLPDEEKIEYLKTLPPEMVWRMAEGNPAQDVTSGGKALAPTLQQKSEADLILNKFLDGRNKKNSKQ